MKPVRLLLADDHALVRAGLRALLDRMTNVQVVGEAGDGRELLSLVAEHRPDVVLCDLSMPGLHGLQAIEQIAATHPNIKTLVVSVHTNEAHVAQAIKLGAAGYLAKDSVPAELEKAIATVMRGERYLSASVAQAQEISGLEHPLDQLTARQREVLQLLAEGHNPKDIAFTLGLSVKTVETHRAHIMARLGLRDLPSLVRWAIRNGLVSPET